MSVPLVNFLVIEIGSSMALLGGYLTLDEVYSGSARHISGLLIGLAGLITAATPIYMAWMRGRQENLKIKTDAALVESRVDNAEAKAKILKDEVDLLRESVDFNRRLVQEYQGSFIEQMVSVTKILTKIESHFPDIKGKQ